MADGPARYALYYAPEPDDPLHQAGASWLGRDAETGAPCRQPDLPGIAAATADPRRYGFHATLKPPMRLRPGVAYADLLAAAAAIAARLSPFDLPPLRVAEWDGFLTLLAAKPGAALQAMADACVTGADTLRAAPDAAELARRRAHGLAAREEALLQRWGYPHVMDAWRFHMTLSRRLSAAEQAVFAPAAAAHFAAALARPRRVVSLCLFTQRAPDAPFLIAERLPLGSAGGTAHVGGG